MEAYQSAAKAAQADIDYFEAFCGDWIASGVQIIGGCCGLTPEHIRGALRARDKKRAS